MSSIYELTDDWLKFYEMADDESMDEDSWFGMMEQIDGELEDKAENTQKVRVQLLSEAEAMKAEAKRLTERAKARENQAEALKKNLEKMMVATGKTKFKTNLFSFGIQKNPPSLKIAEGFNVNDAPAEFIKWAEPTLDKKALTDAIKAGQEFEFAHLEQSEGLRIR